MNTKILDRRTTGGTAIKDMPDGTWFTTNLGLFLKASQDVCVEIATGTRQPFNEDHLAQPVEVDTSILRDTRI